MTDYHTIRDFEHVHVKFVDSPITARIKSGSNKAVISIRPPFGTDHDLQLVLDKRDALNKQRCATTGSNINGSYKLQNNIIVDRYPTITNLKDHYSSLTKKEFRVRKKNFDPSAKQLDKSKQLEHIERLLAPSTRKSPQQQQQYFSPLSNNSNRRDREGSYSLPNIKKTSTNDEYDSPIKGFKNILARSNDEYDSISKSNRSYSSSNSSRKM